MRITTVSDEQLVTKVLAGDTEAYRQLVERYRMPLLRYAVYLIHDGDAAEDIVQDSFIKAYRNLQGFKPRYKFSSWLYRIVHNTAMDSVRHHPAVSLDDDPSLAKYTAVEPDIAEQIDAQMAAKDLNHCLGELSVKYREPIVLYYLQHKSYQEISDVLHISVSAVGVRVNRAKQKLRSICNAMGVKL